MAKDIQRLEKAESELPRGQKEGDQEEKANARMMPAISHILDNYPILTIPERNHLWKSVPGSATVYRSQDDILTVHIFPNLPN